MRKNQHVFISSPIAYVGVGFAIILLLLGIVFNILVIPDIQKNGYHIAIALGTISCIIPAWIMFYWFLPPIKNKIIFDDRGIKVIDKKQEVQINWEEIQEIGFKEMIKLSIGIYFSKEKGFWKDERFMFLNNTGGQVIGLQITNKLVKILPWILSHYSEELVNLKLVTHKDILRAIEKSKSM